jgi:hypothetical protein
MVTLAAGRRRPSRGMKLLACAAVALAAAATADAAPGMCPSKGAACPHIVTVLADDLVRHTLDGRPWSHAIWSPQLQSLWWKSLVFAVRMAFSAIRAGDGLLAHAGGSPGAVWPSAAPTVLPPVGPLCCWPQGHPQCPRGSAP